MNPKMTIAEAKQELREAAKGEGDHCPVCGQFAKVYKRSITSSMAYGLIQFYKAVGAKPGHVPTILNQRGGDFLKLRYWGLIQESGAPGYWFVTPTGAAYVKGLTSAPQYAYVFDGRLLKLDGPFKSIAASLGKKFDYSELMSA